jgi:hypothetical protein
MIAKVEANNTSTKPTDSISLTLRQKITLTANRTTHVVSNIVAKSKVGGFQPCFFGVRFVPFQVVCACVFASLLRASEVGPVACAGADQRAADVGVGSFGAQRVQFRPGDSDSARMRACT